MVDGRKPSTIESAEAIGAGLTVGVASILGSAALAELVIQLDPRAARAACSIVVVPAIVVACVAAGRRGLPHQRLLGLLLTAPLAMVALERHVDPQLAGWSWAFAIGLVISALVVASRSAWTLLLAPGLDGFSMALHTHAVPLASFGVAAVVALGASAVTTRYDPGVSEWRDVETFLVRSDLPRAGEGELDESRLGLVPLFRQATLLRLSDTATVSARWRTSRGASVNVHHDQVEWADCSFDAVGSAPCSLSSRGRFAILETNLATIVMEPNAWGVTYCALGEGRESMALSDIGFRRLGAPLEASALVVVGSIAGLLLLLAGRWTKRARAALPDHPVGYRDASQPQSDVDNRAAVDARGRDLAAFAVVVAFWLAMPALSAHLHGFTVGLR